MSEGDSFLSRWSRRKRAAETAAPPPPDTAALPEEPPLLPDPVDAPTPEPALTDEELAALPRIEDLVPGSDIRAFLRPGVPAPLKNAALRRMWLLTPAIRDHRDPAVDYAWDWNTPGGVPGDGCGPSPERAADMLRDLLRPPEPQPEKAAAALPADPAESMPGSATASAKPAPEAQDQPAPPPSESAAPAQDEGPAGPGAGRRRHGGALPA